MYFVSLSSCMVIKLSPKFQFIHNVSNKLHLGQQIQGNETNSSMGHHSVIFPGVREMLMAIVSLEIH